MHVNTEAGTSSSNAEKERKRSGVEGKIRYSAVSEGISGIAYAIPSFLPSIDAHEGAHKHHR
jgi:hypothetical protein